MPLVLLVTQGNQGGGIDDDLRHLEAAEVVVMSLREIRHAGIDCNPFDVLKECPPRVLAQSPFHGLGQQTNDAPLWVR
jgi:hypothetical protein